MTYAYRPMALDDYEEVYALWRQTIPGALDDVDSRESVCRYLSQNPEQSFLCHEHGAVIGTILCGNDGRRAYIHHLAVLPEHRRRGIASELVRRALAAQKARGIDKCNLFAFNENDPGSAFWRHEGFAFRDDLRLMSKWI